MLYIYTQNAIYVINMCCHRQKLTFYRYVIFIDYNLPQQKIYSLAGHVLALKNNISAIEQLIKCCRSSGAPNAHIISDHVLAHCVKLLLTHSYSEQNSTIKNHIDNLIRLIIDTELRVRFTPIICIDTRAHM